VRGSEKKEKKLRYHSAQKRFSFPSYWVKTLKRRGEKQGKKRIQLECQPERGGPLFFVKRVANPEDRKFGGERSRGGKRRYPCQATFGIWEGSGSHPKKSKKAISGISFRPQESGVAGPSQKKTRQQRVHPERHKHWEEGPARKDKRREPAHRRPREKTYHNALGRGTAGGKDLSCRGGVFWARGGGFGCPLGED